MTLRRLARLEGVAGNPVRALHELLAVVDAQGEARIRLPVRVRFGRRQNLELAQTDAERHGLVDDLDGDGNA